MEAQQATVQKTPTRGGKLPPIEVRMKNLTGRAKGTPNKTTRILKEAILMAAEQVGDRTNRGKDGLVGYLRYVARAEPVAFCSLLGKVLPLTIAGDKNNPLVHHVKLTLVRAEGAAKPEPRVINAEPTVTANVKANAQGDAR